MAARNTVLVLGLLLVAANAVASGEAGQLWSTVKTGANTPVKPLPGVAGQLGINQSPNGNINIPSQVAPGVPLPGETITPGGGVYLGPWKVN